MIGATSLCFEGAEKIHHRLTHRHGGADHPPAVVQGPEAEAKVVAGAVRTDFILSAEIMVIALKEVLDEGLAQRAVILVVVALLITGIVYGVVALIVKMDDVGLILSQRPSTASQRVGHLMVTAMPKLLGALSVIGMAAMLWVGGHILLVGAAELGWEAPYDFVHDLEKSVADLDAVGDVLAWTINTLISALVGLVVGLIVVAVVAQVRRRRT
jgi:predicted DNA repair protein MutK